MASCFTPARSVTVHSHPPAPVRVTRAAGRCYHGVMVTVFGQRTRRAARTERTPRTIGLPRRVFCIAAVAALAFSLPAAAESRDAELFLWELRRGEATGYVLGSIHYGTPDLYPLDDRIYAAFGSATLLVLEADITTATQSDLEAIVAERGMYPPGRSLATEIEPELYEELAALFTGFGVPIVTVETARPWLMEVGIAAVLLEMMGFSGSLGVEEHFVERAGRAGIPIEGLETVTRGIEALSSLPDDLQARSLATTLSTIHELPDRMERLVDAWRRGDRETVAEFLLFDPDDPVSAMLNEELLIQRNHEWADRIDALLAAGGAPFIVVGAGHLVGPDNLIDLLEARGIGALPVAGARRAE